MNNTSRVGPSWETKQRTCQFDLSDSPHCSSADVTFSSPSITGRYAVFVRRVTRHEVRKKTFASRVRTLLPAIFPVHQLLVDVDLVQSVRHGGSDRFDVLETDSFRGRS